MQSIISFDTNVPHFQKGFEHVAILYGQFLEQRFCHPSAILLRPKPPFANNSMSDNSTGRMQSIWSLLHFWCFMLAWECSKIDIDKSLQARPLCVRANTLSGSISKDLSKSVSSMVHCKTSIHFTSVFQCKYVLRINVQGVFKIIQCLVVVVEHHMHYTSISKCRRDRSLAPCQDQ